MDRTGHLKNNAPVYLNRGDEFMFVNDMALEGDHTQVLFFSFLFIPFCSAEKNSMSQEITQSLFH